MNGDWLCGLEIFYKTWFPDAAKQGLAVPGFWFGARKASYKPFFEKLEADCLQAARSLASSSLGLGVATWNVEPRATAPLRMRAAIFLDQTCRNHLSMQRGQALVEANQFKVLCDSVALRLAMSVLVDLDFGKKGKKGSNCSLLNLASVPELCFLSLVLRHAREPFSLKLSEAMLLVILQELSRGPSGPSEASTGVQGHKDLCSRFLEETQDAIQSIVVEAYLEKALSSDRPVQLSGKPDCSPRVSVLDARCQRYASAVHQADSEVSFLSPLTADVSRFQGHFLVDELRNQLKHLGYLHQDVGIVLSLSGGVDSMVTCCLLWLLEQTLPSHQRFRWCAMHLCHPNRDDARDEEGWVQWSCSQLGVDLFSYRPQIRRPHGSIRTGISRERYEEKSKQIRFRMYELCLQRLGVSKGAALVAHHEDDADENRLAELGKGNIVHINGMLATGITLNVTVLRPLLKVRKGELIAFADLAHVCYMQDLMTTGTRPFPTKTATVRWFWIFLEADEGVATIVATKFGRSSSSTYGSKLWKTWWMW